jgi:hypothetical protein
MRASSQCRLQCAEKGIVGDDVDDHLEHDQHHQQHEDREPRQLAGNAPQALIPP